MVKYACKVTSSGCLSSFFTAVREDIPTCMPEEILPAKSLSSSLFAGSNPAVRCGTYRLWIGLSLGTQQKTARVTACRERFINQSRYHSAERGKTDFSVGAMQKRALPENGYRVFQIGAKRVLSAPRPRRLRFQPPLLHE